MTGAWPLYVPETVAPGGRSNSSVQPVTAVVVAFLTMYVPFHQEPLSALVNEAVSLPAACAAGR